VGAEAFGPQFPITLPEFFVVWERIDHLGPFAVPLRMLVAREDVVGHVAGTDDRAGHDAADLLAGPRQAEDRAGQDAFAGGALRERPGRFIGLWVVEHYQARPHGMPIGSLVLHAANPAGDTGN